MAVTRVFAMVVLFAAMSLPIPAQTLLEEHFDDVAGLWSQGWVKKNRSYPLGPQTWQQGGPLDHAASDGDSLAFIGNGYLAGGFDPDIWTNISDWLFTPALEMQNGDVLSFRALSVACISQPDRLEVRRNANAATYVGDASTSVGDYSVIMLQINENQLPLGMPSVIMGDDWELYSATVSGLGGPTVCRLAIRYFVVNGGPGAPNSSFIGIDDLRITRNIIGVNEHQLRGLSIFPNPTKGLVNFTEGSLPVGSRVRLFGPDGRDLFLQPLAAAGQLDLSALAPGAYIVEVLEPSAVAPRRARIIKE